EYHGRREGGFESMVKFAETIGAGVWSIPNALNFPNKHPLSLQFDKASLKKTDVLLGLDVRDYEKQIADLNSTTREVENITPPNCDLIEIGFGEINISKWAMDYCRMWPTSVRAIGDTILAVPELTRICGERIAKDPKLQKKIADRKVMIGKRHDEVWAR